MDGTIVPVLSLRTMLLFTSTESTAAEKFRIIGLFIGTSGVIAPFINCTSPDMHFDNSIVPASATGSFLQEPALRSSSVNKINMLAGFLVIVISVIVSILINCVEKNLKKKECIIPFLLFQISKPGSKLFFSTL